MAEVPVERQFAGQARLVRLLLWKIGDTTNIAKCLAVAQNQGMIDEDNRSFLEACMAAEEALRPKNAGADASTAPQDALMIPFDITTETIARLRRCADKLNRADSA